MTHRPEAAAIRYYPRRGPRCEGAASEGGKEWYEGLQAVKVQVSQDHYLSSGFDSTYSVRGSGMMYLPGAASRGRSRHRPDEVLELGLRNVMGFVDISVVATETWRSLHYY